MSSAEEPARAGSSPAKDRAWARVDEAREAWRQALRAHKQAPPDPAFRDRLRALADSASALRDAYADALRAGLSWRPIHGSEHSQPPYELRPDTGRHGPDELWARFDAAVQQLNAAGAGDSLADIVAGYGAVAQAAAALADALEAAGE